MRIITKATPSPIHYWRNVREFWCGEPTHGVWHTFNLDRVTCTDCSRAYEEYDMEEQPDIVEAVQEARK